MTPSERMKLIAEKLTAKETTRFGNVFVPKAGTEYRMRILPNIQKEEIDFHCDSYHMIEDRLLADCKDENTCPVCKVMKQLDSDNPLQKKWKPSERYQLQIVLLTEDGKWVDDEEPKLFSVSSIAMNLILASFYQSHETSMFELDLVFRKNSVYDYKGTHFVPKIIEISSKILGNRVTLFSNRVYANGKWRTSANEQLQRYCVELPEDVNEMDAYEKELIDSINK